MESYPGFGGSVSKIKDRRFYIGLQYIYWFYIDRFYIGLQWFVYPKVQ